MAIFFLTLLPKTTQIRHFWSQIQAFSFFDEILQLAKFEGADFKSIDIISKFQSQNIFVKNTQVRHFWSQIKEFLFFREILRSDKFEGTDPKDGNIIFIFQTEIPKQGFFGPKFIHFCFFADLKCDNIVFEFQSKIQAFCFFAKNLQLNKFEGATFKYAFLVAFLVPNLGIFVFSRKFAVRKIRGC